MKSYWFKILSGPVVFFLCLIIGDFDNLQTRMIASLLWMLAWWITTAVPIGVTALLPIVLFPLLGILDLKATTANYANPVIYLFLGGFILGLAVEKWSLHRRIALNIMHLSGEKPNKVILGSMIATALLSMWISNTATAVMMLPIGMSVVGLLGDKLNDAKAIRNFGITMMLGIAYAANVGGMTTLIGTPPNLVLSSLVYEQGLGELSFSSWLMFAFPLVLVLFAVVYWVNTRLIFPIRTGKLDGVRELIGTELRGLGKIENGEKRVLIIMVATALMWIFRSQLVKIPGLDSLSDPMIAIIGAIALFVVPSGQKGRRVLVWKDTEKLPWGILLLFGGGLSLAEGMEVTDIVGLVGDWISNSEIQHPILVVLVVAAFAVYLTEVMSNVALVSVFIPVSFVIAENLAMPELQLALPLTLGSSCAFMFPISTPPNAIVFGSGQIKMNEMMKTGFLLNILCIAVIVLYCWFFQGYFF